MTTTESVPIKFRNDLRKYFGLTGEEATAMIDKLMLQASIARGKHRFHLDIFAFSDWVTAKAKERKLDTSDMSAEDITRELYGADAAAWAYEAATKGISN